MIATSFETLTDYFPLFLPSALSLSLCFLLASLVWLSNFGTRYCQRCPNAFPRINGTTRLANIAFCMATTCVSMSEVGLSCTPLSFT